MQIAVRDELLKLVKRIKVEESVTESDDGRTQEVQAKKGITLAEERGAAQPDDAATLPYLPRGRAAGEPVHYPDDPAGAITPAKLALFEADAGKWQLEAVSRVAAYLETGLSGIGVRILA